MVILPGVVFAMLAGLHYYWPKMFGYMLNEKLGKAEAWIISMSTLLAFMPMFFSGLDGQSRRMYTYSESTGFGIYNMISFVGAIGLAIGFALIVYNVYYSMRYASRDISSDPWDARSLEWATHSPVPEYNFAITPHVNSLKHFGMRRNMVTNYSLVNMRKFICQITVVYHLSWAVSFLHGDSHSYSQCGFQWS